MNSRAAIATVLLIASGQALSADLPAGRWTGERAANFPPPEIRGRASVISGDTLWFPELGQGVHLEGIQSCALPQWAFDPSIKSNTAVPIPCGPLAKAWLKRSLGSATVKCIANTYSNSAFPSARCMVRGRDLGLEMLRVGWARARSAPLLDPQYLAAERSARAARYGLWGTYFLDMDEWQGKAVDRTAARRPLADWNLLSDREQDTTPPFADWRNRPRRTDR
jgi:endonuclease YncB( thermonuclease family)